MNSFSPKSIRPDFLKSKNRGSAIPSLTSAAEKATGPEAFRDHDVTAAFGDACKEQNMHRSYPVLRYGTQRGTVAFRAQHSSSSSSRSTVKAKRRTRELKAERLAVRSTSVGSNTGRRISIMFPLLSSVSFSSTKYIRYQSTYLEHTAGRFTHVYLQTALANAFSSICTLHVLHVACSAAALSSFRRPAAVQPLTPPGRLFGCKLIS